MSSKKLRVFQLCDYQSRLAKYPVTRFIFSEELNDIVTIYNKPYAFRYENATGKIIKGLIHPGFVHPQHDVAALLQTVIKFGFKGYKSRKQDFESVYTGVFDMYLVPATHTFSSESLLPMFRDTYKLWVSDSNMIGSPTYFIDVFQLKLWLAFILSFIAIVLILTLAINHLKKFARSHPDTFNCFSLITNQGGDDHQTKFLSIKLLFMSLSIVVIMFHGSFEAFLSSYLAMCLPDLPFNDLSGLLDSKDYTICVSTLSPGVAQYTKTALIEHQMPVDRLNNERCPGMLRKFGENFTSITLDDRKCPGRKTVIIAANIWGFFQHERGLNENCPIMQLPGNYFPSYITLPVSQGFQYKEHFNHSTIRLISGGHVHYLHNRFRLDKNTAQSRKHIYYEDLNSINFHQAQLMFWILIFGVALSWLVFIVEHIVKRIQQ